jgi:hypothetical protein
MNDMSLRLNSVCLASGLGAFLSSGAEAGNLFLNPVKIVKFISKSPTFLNGTDPRCGRFS